MVFLLLIWSSCLIAGDYKFQTIAVPEARHTITYGLSDLGDVVGVFADCDFCPSLPFIFSDGNYSELGVAGARIAPLGINRDGQIAGQLVTETDSFGFIMDQAETTILDQANRVDGINNKGVVVGLQVGTPGGFVWRNGVYRAVTLGGLNGYSSAATGINNRGDIVGYYWIGADKPVGFVHKGSEGSFTPLTEIIPLGINRDGVIVGYTGPGNDGAVLENGIIQLIKYPGADYTQVHGINNKGHLVGYYVKAGQYFGFIAEPVSPNKRAGVH